MAELQSLVSAGGLDDNGVGNQGQPSGRKKKNVTTACERCRSSKQKCDGANPCGQCERKMQFCQYSPGPDGRKTIGLKRKLEDYQHDSNILHDLLELIRGHSDKEVCEVIRMVQNGAPVLDLEAFVAAKLKERARSRESNEDLEELNTQLIAFRESVASTSMIVPLHTTRAVAFDISRLTDAPPYQVTAAPWTTVTSDDGLVSNLVSLWMTWEKSWCNFIDEELFLRDMQRKELGATYCSPFLVNCILAAACPYSDYEEVKTTAGATSQMMEEFVLEAERLLHTDISHPTLTTVQGLVFLISSISVMGRDSVGFQYIKLCVAACQKVMRAHTDDKDSEYASALNTTCWGVFNFVTIAALAWQKPPEMDEPNRPKPERRQDKYEWIPYPAKQPVMQDYSRELLYHSSNLAPIAKDVALRLSLRPSEWTLIETLEYETNILYLHECILGWRASLPDHLTPKESSPASVYIHHCNTLILEITMFGPLSDPKNNASPIIVEKARSMCIDAAREIAHVCRLHQAAFGLQQMTAHYVHTVPSALSVLLSVQKDENILADIEQLFAFLRALAKRWTFAMAVLRMLQLGAMEDKSLPKEITDLFEDFEKSDWAQRQARQIISSYPSNFAYTRRYADDGISAKYMGDFLEQMDKLNVNAGDDTDN